MAHMPELFQGCDEQGRATSPVAREDAARGALHLAAHLWVWRRGEDGLEILLQRRAADKRTWPGFYDISAAGHVDAGEDPVTAVLREAKEEINIDIAVTDIQELFVFRSNKTDATSGIIENEVERVYATEAKATWQYELVDGEVSELRWISIETFELAAAGQNEITVVPQGEQYFAQLINAIKAMADEDH